MKDDSIHLLFEQIWSNLTQFVIMYDTCIGAIFYISAKNGPIAMKRKANISTEL